MKCLALCLVFAIFGITVDAFGGIPGGANQITDDDKKNYLLDKVKRHLQALSGKPNHPQFEYVDHSSATYQVVAGTLYQLNGKLKVNDQEVNCLMKLWEKPWMNFEKFTADCDEEPKRTYESIVGVERRRKRATLLGGAQEVPEEEWPELHTKMQSAFELLNAKHENMKNYKYKNIVGATKQVVSGISFKVNVLVGIGESDSECQVSVWEKSWENFQKISFECEDAKYEYTSSPATAATQ